MATPSYRQDYIARIRYSNALPPPPCPPKLLDIPNTGLSSGQYTSAGFASRLAREQPLNIEADAELGMPIDLVGIPGVFDGDASAIQTMPNPPPLNARDRALMRPPNALGRPTAQTSGVSFLRRTEYITSAAVGGSRFESSNSTNTMRMRGKRRRVDMSEDDPQNIIRHIVKGFNIAYPQDANVDPNQTRGADVAPQEKQAWKTPKHPNKDVELVDSYPILPDWDAIPDTGSYMVYKFMAPPVQRPNDPNFYDERLDVALLRPAGQTMADHQLYLQEQEAHRTDPTSATPIPRYQFEFFLPADDSKEKVHGIKRNFTTYDPDNAEEIPFEYGEDPETQTQRKLFKYDNIRTYETSQQVGDPEDVYGDTIALALHDPKHYNDPLRDTPLQKGAFFYPIIQRTNIRARRPGRVDMYVKEGESENVHVDIVEAIGRDPVGEVERRDAVKRRYDVVSE